jgi:hypothetical protein
LPTRGGASPTTLIGKQLRAAMQDHFTIACVPHCLRHHAVNCVGLMKKSHPQFREAPSRLTLHSIPDPDPNPKPPVLPPPICKGRSDLTTPLTQLSHGSEPPDPAFGGHQLPMFPQIPRLDRHSAINMIVANS